MKKIAQIVSLFFVSLSLPVSVFATTTYYVDGATGDDANDGSQAAPWKTLNAPPAKMSAGDTVVIAGGIYFTNPFYIFGPKGTGFDNLTTYVAAPGARVIVTGPDKNSLPKLTPADYVKIDGLWIGGTRNDATIATSTADFTLHSWPEPLGIGKVVVNSTIFGMQGGIAQSKSQDIFIQNNRFIDTGDGSHSHGIYVAGNDDINNPTTRRAIVDHNIFIGGLSSSGYGIHGWHSTISDIITRNVVINHSYGIALDGREHIVANNFVYNTKNNIGFYMRMYPGKTVIRNNIFAYNSAVSGTASSYTMTNNAYLSVAPQGTASIILNPSNGLNDLGLNKAEFDAAYKALQASFYKSLDEIYADQTIEPNLAKLWPTIATTSPLYRKGTYWYSPGVITRRTGYPNIGPDTNAPSTRDGFIAALGYNGLIW